MSKVTLMALRHFNNQVAGIKFPAIEKNGGEKNVFWKSKS